MLKNFFSKKPAESEVLPGKDPITVTKNWYADRYQSLLVQRNLLALVTLAAMFGIGFSVFAVYQVTQSKSIEPFVIEVEEKTGIATVVRPLSIKEFSANEAMKRALLVNYIRAREGYNASLVEHNYYNVVRLMSSRGIWRSFQQFISQTNPESPVNVYQSRTVVLVGVKSIIFQEDNTAQVRFTLTGEGPRAPNDNKIALIEFTFNALTSMNQEERYINPLGFQIVRYHVDDDIS